MSEINSTGDAVAVPLPRLQIVKSKKQKAAHLNPELRRSIAYSFHQLELPIVAIARRLGVSYQQIGRALIQERMAALEAARAESYRAGFRDGSSKGPSTPPPTPAQPMRRAA